jgi:hypothetical protein
MKSAQLGALVAAAAALSGCSLIDSSALSIGYTFDPQEFKQTIGDERSTATLPRVACTPGEMPDPCAAVNAQLPMGSPAVSCDGTRMECVASMEVRLPQEVDLRSAKTPVPDEVVKLGASTVGIDRVNYWAATNTLNVATPPIDIYVAAATARDERDPTAVKLGSIASLPAKSKACGDPQDPSDDAVKQGQTVCSMPLTKAGQDALAAFIKNFRNAPFQIIVRATLTATAETPVPAGTIDVFVRPRVIFGILR